MAFDLIKGLGKSRPLREMPPLPKLQVPSLKLAPFDAIPWLETVGPEEWHRVVTSWNWDRGTAPLRWIAEQDACDRGTALHMLFAGYGPHYFSQYDRVEDIPNLDYVDHEAHLCGIVIRRFAEGHYRHYRFHPEVSFVQMPWNLPWAVPDVLLCQKIFGEHVAPLPGSIEGIPIDALDELGVFERFISEVRTARFTLNTVPVRTVDGVITLASRTGYGVITDIGSYTIRPEEVLDVEFLQVPEGAFGPPWPSLGSAPLAGRAGASAPDPEQVWSFRSIARRSVLPLGLVWLFTSALIVLWQVVLAPSGTDASIGYARVGEDAPAWVQLVASVSRTCLRLLVGFTLVNAFFRIKDRGRKMKPVRSSS